MITPEHGRTTRPLSSTDRASTKANRQLKTSSSHWLETTRFASTKWIHRKVGPVQSSTTS